LRNVAECWCALIAVAACATRQPTLSQGIQESSAAEAAAGSVDPEAPRHQAVIHDERALRQRESASAVACLGDGASAARSSCLASCSNDAGAAHCQVRYRQCLDVMQDVSTAERTSTCTAGLETCVSDFLSPDLIDPCVERCVSEQARGKCP
jgi:hypothetical protein